jgi:hypothetical protein
MVPNFSQKLGTFGSEPLQPASELMKLKRVREEKQQLDLWCLWLIAYLQYYSIKLYEQSFFFIGGIIDKIAQGK